jgi:NAD(P)H-dependent FMN reductase
MSPRPLLIPVLLGTVRRTARSAAVARLVATRTASLPDVETRLLTIDELGLVADDEGTGIADREFSALIDRSDALVIVAPEYNHGYPGSLKHALDTNYHEYVHKPVGLVGVSTGTLGGARMIENLSPVLRAVGLVLIQRDVTVDNVAERFAEDGATHDERLLGRIDGMLVELRWMAHVLRHGRESIPRQPGAAPAICPTCSSEMNQHAETSNVGAEDAVMRLSTCPHCLGNQIVTPAE